MRGSLQLDLWTGRRDDGKTGSGISNNRPSSRPPILPFLHLTDRLYALGVPHGTPIQTHANRRILVSRTARGALRVHQGFAMAPDEVVAAIARWAEPRVPTAERRKAQRILTAFPVHHHVPPMGESRRVREPLRPGDERILARLRELHTELNARHFAGSLGGVALLLSSRMRRRLGDFRPAESAGEPPEITISRRHLRRDGWSAVRETLAHEMVHQWQAATGQPLSHDAGFRRRCREIGIDGRATRLDRDLP